MIQLTEEAYLTSTIIGTGQCNIVDINKKLLWPSGQKMSALAQKAIGLGYMDKQWKITKFGKAMENLQQ